MHRTVRCNIKNECVEIRGREHTGKIRLRFVDTLKPRAGRKMRETSNPNVFFAECIRLRNGLRLAIFGKFRLTAKGNPSTFSVSFDSEPVLSQR